MCLHVVKFSLHECRYMVCLTLKLCWALEIVSDAVRRRSRRGFNYKNFRNFFQKKTWSIMSLYEGVFGPSLTSLFDISKPLPLFIIDIYTLHSVLRHDSRQFLHLCDLDNYLVGSLGFWWCHFCTGSMVTWTMQARCRVHMPIHMSYVAVLHDDNWCGQILVFSPENKATQACV